MAICRKHHEVGRLQDLNEFSTRIAHANFSSWKIHPLTWLPWTISVEKSPTNGCPIPSIVSFFITISFFLKIKTINSKDSSVIHIFGIRTLECCSSESIRRTLGRCSARFWNPTESVLYGCSLVLGLAAIQTNVFKKNYYPRLDWILLLCLGLRIYQNQNKATNEGHRSNL